MAPGAHWTLPPASDPKTRRHLYFFRGRSVKVGAEDVSGPRLIELDPTPPVELVNGDVAGEFLMLQGRPIGEPVAQYGPFVMNSQAEIAQTLQDYRRTQFGRLALARRGTGPWPRAGPLRPPSGRPDRGCWRCDVLRLRGRRRFADRMTTALPPAVSGERIDWTGPAGPLSAYVAGNGPPLLLVHSVNAAASAAEVKPIHEHFRSTRTVFSIDLPGYGFSERSDRDYTPRLIYRCGALGARADPGRHAGPN